MKKLFIFVIMAIFVLSIIYSSENNNLTNETSTNTTNTTAFNLTESNETYNVTEINESEDIVTSEIKEKISEAIGIDEPFSSIKFDISDIGTKIESRIYGELEKKNKTRVIVILKEDWIFEKKLSKKEKFRLRKEKIREKQNEVLSQLTENFELKNRYKTINAFSGVLTKAGLTVLKHSPFVERVYLDRKAYTSLLESVPLIKADDVWNLGYTGTGSVCITDTGVDYTHPDLGNPSCSISQTINGNTESYLLESPHPYTNNYDYTWTINKPGYSNIAVHFDRIDVEDGYDFVYLYNAQGNFIQVFTGSYDNIWSISIPGDTMKVRLVVDYSITDWGFKIDQVLDGTIDSSWSNCGQIIGGYDFQNNDYEPMDGDGHGTHVAGIVASQDETYKGVSPGTNIVAVKILDDTGYGWFSNVAAGVDWCIDNKDKYSIHTISMSLGDGGEYNNPETQCDPYVVAQAINYAFSQGIFVSVASGNEAHLNGISYPACASNATSVGAVYDANVGRQRWGSPPICTDSTTAPDKIVCFTNRDEILNLLAPGSLITSTVPGGFGTYSGTSMAAPHVAGVASLMLDADNTLTPSQIKDVMKNTGKLIYDSATGLYFPRINASAAVKAVIPAEIISITLFGYPIDFANLDPETNNNSALGNSGNQYKIRVDPETTINVDLYQKGNNFTGPAILGISNMSWYNTNNVGSAIPMKNIYENPTATNIIPNTNISSYYWINIPVGQKAGSYTSTIYIKAVETGT